jgi:hypothetical protein
LYSSPCTAYPLLCSWRNFILSLVCGEGPLNGKHDTVLTAAKVADCLHVLCCTGIWDRYPEGDGVFTICLFFVHASCCTSMLSQFRGLTINGVCNGYWIYWLLKHNSEPQVITVLSLISTL